MASGISSKLTLLITVVSILIPIILWGVDRESYVIDVQRLEPEILVKFVDEESGLEFVYLGDAVENPTLNRFHIKNSGSEPINKVDFDRPIKFTMNEDILILNAYVASTFPKSMPVNLVVTGNSVELEPLLLNSNDIINISVLTSGVPEEISLSGRVARVAELELEDADIIETMYPIFAFKTVSFVLAGFMYFYFAFAAFRNEGYVRLSRVFCFAIAFMSLISFQYLYNSVTRAFGIESDLLFWGLLACQGLCAWFFIMRTRFYRERRKNRKNIRVKTVNDGS